MDKHMNVNVLLEFLSDAVYAWKGEVSHYFKAVVNQNTKGPCRATRTFFQSAMAAMKINIIWILYSIK